MNTSPGALGAIGIALVSAALFGAATPASKLLLDDFTPFQLAGLLYLGAAIGVFPTAWKGGRLRLPADTTNRYRLLGAVLSGGVTGPLFLLLGLRSAAAASVSLWLNFELAATALLGALFFREYIGRLGWGGVATAFVGAGILAFGNGIAGAVPACFVLAACLCWGLDNHLTALIDGITPSQSTFWKGVVAGVMNLAIGVVLTPLPASVPPLLAAIGVGVLAYGASIVLYISAAQRLGATRAQIAFASAPFFGVLLSGVLLAEPITAVHFAAGALFIGAIVLLTLEQHSHHHTHQPIEHEHSHRHDDGHHDHVHPELPPSTRHSHPHRHEAMEHAHPHWPDLHHRHTHHADSN